METILRSFAKRIAMLLVVVVQLSCFGYNTTVNGITWNYTVSISNGKATVVSGSSGSGSLSGAITIPSSLGGYPVTQIATKAFYDCQNITSVTIPDSVTNIGSFAFCNCSGLTSVTIPDSVTAIGEWAFSNCYRLTKVTMPDSVTSIGDKAFYGCRGLATNGLIILQGALWQYVGGGGEVIIPNGVTNIGSSAFYGCSGLTRVTIPDSVVSIGYYAFSDCSGLTSVTIPDSVTSIGDSAFSNCSSLTSVTIPNSVTSIGPGAFCNCSGLTSVTIPNSVSIIWPYAFASCRELTSITIPENLASIGDSVFSGCTRLANVVIPDSVTSIGNHAFEYCRGLASVRIGDGVTSIGDYAFYDCSGLTSVTIPDSVTSIGDHAFDGCGGLTDVTIPDSVMSIGDYAFYCCYKLANVTMSSSVPNVGRYVFSRCGGLSVDGFIVLNGVLWQYEGGEDAVTIPDNVTSIGSYAFYNRSGIMSVTMGGSVTNIGVGAFEGCTRLMSVTISDSVTSIGASAFSGCAWLTGIVIPSNVTSIGDNAFYNCSGLARMEISDSVTNIGDGAFYNCSRLANIVVSLKHGCSQRMSVFLPDLYRSITSVTIAEGVDRIGDSVFYNCNGLTSVTMPNSVTSIGDSAFYGCTSLARVYITDLAKWCGISFGSRYANPLYYAHDLYLNDSLITDLIIPDGVTNIGSYVFYNCSGLTSVTIPDSVTSIGIEAFRNCSGLASVTIPDGITSIGGAAFCGCSGLTSVTIGDSVTNIGNSAFYDCSGLTSVTIPSSVTNIGSYAFYNCSGLTSVTISNSVTRIGDNAFYGCNGLATNGLIILQGVLWQYVGEGGSVDIPNGVTGIGQEAFSGCRNLTSVTIPDSVTSIGIEAFRNCSGLASVTIPDSVTNIGDRSFYGCSGLTSVTIPDSVVSIGIRAFSGCSGLKSVTIPNSVTSIGNEAFESCSGLISVKIPDSVTTIGNGAFYGCTSLARVYITDLAKWCGISFGSYYANPLYYANDLYLNDSVVTDLVIPDGVMRIGSYAFYNCSGLASVTMPDSVTSVGSSAFYGCTSLARVYITDLAKWCGISFGSGSANPLCYAHDLILNDSVVTDLIMPGGVTSIGSYAFYNCSRLVSVTIPESVRSIGSGAFSGCSGLTSVTIPNSVTNIGSSAFSGCRGLTSVTIPDSVTSIGSSAFSGCSGLTEITIPFVGSMRGNSGSSDSLFGYIFGSHSYPDSIYVTQRYSLSSYSTHSYYIPSALKSVTITDETSLGYGAFYNCSSLTRVVMPDKVTGIGADTFYGCSGLAENGFIVINGVLWQYVGGGRVVTIPDNVTSIVSFAFHNCGWLTSVTIPGSVTSIGDSAFQDCKSLQHVSVPGWLRGRIDESNVFSNCPATLEIVYEETIGLYLDAPGLSFTDGDASDWCCDNVISHDGRGSVCLKGLGANSKSSIVLTLPSAGRLFFWWKASSESYGDDVFDYAYLSVDGVDKGTRTVDNEEYRLSGCAIGGSTDWKQIVVDIEGVGPHMVRWTYVKDEVDDGDVGEDCVWLDELVFVPLVSARFDIGGGMGVVPPMVKELRGAVIELPGQEGIEWEDYVFDGWSDGVTLYAPGAEYTVPSEDVTLTAQWTKKTFIVFDLGGGVGTVPPMVKKLHGTIIELPGREGIECEDHVFDGWSDGVTLYAAGAEYMIPSEDVTLTAQWTKKTFLAFDLDGGVGMVPPMVKELRGTIIELPGQEGFEREDHVFNGWSDGANLYAAGAEYTMPDEDVTLTAQWTKKTFLAFDLGGGDGTVPQMVKELRGAVIELPGQDGIEWGDHVFNGWSDGVNTYVAGAEYTVPDEDVTLTAQWTKKTFLAFDLGGGVGTVPSMVKELRGIIVLLPEQDGIEWEDHVFNGWSDGVTLYAPSAEYTVPSEDVTLTAQWIAKRIVTFVLDGGYGEIPATVKDIPDSIITLPSADGFAKAKHRFVGWSDGTKVYEAGAEYVVSDSNIEFSAVWEAKTLSAPAISSTDVENGGTHESAYALISIAAEAGASIYYTVDGAEPTTKGILYVAPIMAFGKTEIIRAIAVRDDYFDSAISEFAFSRKPYSAAECLDVAGVTVLTGGGDSAWSRVLGSAAHDGVAAMRSGAIGDSGSSSIEMTVVGAGEIGFWWKSSSEISRNRKFDYVSFLIDGDEQSWMGGEMDWTNEVFAVTGSGAHIFKWVYQKNDNGLTKGEDCAWLDGVTWTPTDPIPAVATDAAPETVANAIDAVGFADADAVKAAIGGSAAEYAAFKTWAGSVKGKSGVAVAGEAAVVANTNAAAAFMLGAERLFENAPVVEIGEVEVRRQDAGSPSQGGDGGAGSQGVTVSVVVKDGEEAVRCAAEKVKEMFEATRELGDWEGEARLTPTVDVLDGDGETMRFRVTPGDGKSSSAFLRIRK